MWKVKAVERVWSFPCSLWEETPRKCSFHIITFNFYWEAAFKGIGITPGRDIFNWSLFSFNEDIHKADPFSFNGPSESRDLSLSSRLTESRRCHRCPACFTKPVDVPSPPWIRTHNRRVLICSVTLNLKYKNREHGGKYTSEQVNHISGLLTRVSLASWRVLKRMWVYVTSATEMHHICAFAFKKKAKVTPAKMPESISADRGTPGQPASLVPRGTICYDIPR